MPSVLRSAVLLGGIVATSAVIIAATSPGTRETRPGADADSAAVAQVVSDFHKALTTADSAGALALLAPDAVILESGGVETRAEYRSHHLAGDIGFAKAVVSTRGPLQVTVAGSTAWTAGTSTTQGEFNGRTINSAGAESMVLTKGSTGWRIRAIHWSSRNRRPPAT